MQNYWNVLDTLSHFPIFSHVFSYNQSQVEMLQPLFLNVIQTMKNFQVKKDIYPILTNVRTVYNIANVTVAYVTIANVTRLSLTVMLAYRKFAYN